MSIQGIAKSYSPQLKVKQSSTTR